MTPDKLLRFTTQMSATSRSKISLTDKYFFYVSQPLYQTNRICAYRIEEKSGDFEIEKILQDGVTNQNMLNKKTNEFRCLPDKPIVFTIRLKSFVTDATNDNTAAENLPPHDITQQLPSPHTFFHPSSFNIKQCCTKLNIRYSHEAYVFWSRISIDQFSINSQPRDVYSPTTENDAESGWRCLSVLFTGQENNFEKIAEKFRQYFYDNFATLGNCQGHDFATLSHADVIVRQTIFSSAFTDVFCEVCAQWLQCRVGVFNGGELKRYGSWQSTDENLLTIVLKLDKNKFQIVISVCDS